MVKKEIQKFPNLKEVRGEQGGAERTPPRPAPPGLAAVPSRQLCPPGQKSSAQSQPLFTGIAQAQLPADAEAAGAKGRFGGRS